MAPPGLWRQFVVMAAFSLLAPATVGAGNPGDTAARSWPPAAWSLVAVGMPPGPSEEGAFLQDDSQIPGVIAAAGDRQRTPVLLARRLGNPPKPRQRHRPGPDDAQGHSTLLLGLGAAQLRAPPAPQPA